ncbi:MAG: D-alanyl-D-alanine carboxypeptidase, partial [Streptococcaceae bacterium]|nr:D-alanyl-D-alanine carboxypeptidase [Streptococcaceae bacterium]
MNNKFKKIVATTMAFFSLSTTFLSTPVLAQESADTPELVEFNAASKAAISVDFETGKIFYAKDADTPHGIASITKLLTAYITLDQVKQGNFKWDDTIAASQYAHQLSIDPRLSGVPLELGREYNIRELYEASLIASANGAAVLLAEKIAGSEEKFVQMMSAQMEEWGIKDSHLVNASGLNNSLIPEAFRIPGVPENDENLMSARGVAIIARHIMKEFPEVLETTSKPMLAFGQKTFSGVEVRNWNAMLPDMPAEYPGVDGLKTGTTTFAGQCFVGTAKKEDWRIITV